MWEWDGTSGWLFSAQNAGQMGMRHGGQGSCSALAEACSILADIRDSLMQALASYVCYPHSLRAVERIPEEQ